MNKEMRAQFEATLKSRDTEEFIDIYLYRPLGFRWAKFFEKQGVHPNVVTLFSIFLGISAGLLFISPSLRWNVVGMFLLVWANTYDSCDGQLARMTGKKTHWGRILDGFAGDVWFFFINLAVVLRSVHQTIPFTDHEWGLTIFILASISGLGYHAYQSRLADYYRQVHLFFLKGEAGSELDNSVKQHQIFEAASWRHDFFWKLFLGAYAAYTGEQEKATPAFQALRTLLTQRYGSHIPASFRTRFCELSRPLMKYTNILTFNTRCIILFLSLFLNMAWLYLFCEIFVMSLICIYMNVKHELICRRLYQEVLHNQFTH